MIDFCVLGSGVAGSTIANLLSKKYSVKVFDKARGPGGRSSNKRLKNNLSFDNVLAVVAASKGNFHLMVIGLLLSVFLIATLATFFADFIKKHQWLGYLGLIVIVIIAIQLIIGGLVNYEVLSINEKFKFLFSI